MSVFLQLYNTVSFIKSVAQINQLPPDSGAELAFWGRSNAGKSSALNAITGIKKLAKTSKTPGRTQLINLFQIDEMHRFVDLPGYGYAKVPPQLRQNWMKLIHQYLNVRKSLKGIILLMDARHPLMPADEEIIYDLAQIKLPMHILLTKADKLSYQQMKKTKAFVDSTLKTYQASTLITTQLFSSMKPIGHEELLAALSHLFQL